MCPESETLTIAVAGDLRGHLIGTVSRDDGQTPIAETVVLATGSTLAGDWSGTATTDAHGLFQITVPCGSIGTIDLRTTYQNQAGSCRVHCGDLALHLTPRPPLLAASRLSLDGEWEFAPDPPDDLMTEASAARADAIVWNTISVPSHWEMAGFRCKTGRAAYRKRFLVPSGWHGKCVRLRAEGVYSTAEVWFNGIRVGSHVGGATPFELDLSAAARPGGGNTLVIVVASQSPASDLDHMSFYAYWNLAGIWRSLDIFCVEPAHIARLAVTTDLVNDYRDGWLNVDVDLANQSAAPLTNARLIVRVHDQMGRVLTSPDLEATVSLAPWTGHSVALSALCMNIEPWSAEIPTLYTLVVEFVAVGQDMARLEERFGFTRVEIIDRTYRFNGQAVKLWGTCHHDIHPLQGRAITTSLLREDVELIKEANHNAVRTSHYPGHPALVELADELGLYVEDEAPFCWVGIDAFGPSVTRPHDVDDLRLAPLWLSITSALVERDRNHPCVCLWSLGNESDYGRNFQLAYAFVHQSDPSRPISCGDHRGDVDVATYHNPLSMERIVASAELPMPMLFDEAMANFQGANQSEALDLDPGLRDYWAVGHIATLEAIRNSPQQAGIMIWAWSDDLALLPGRGVRYWRATQPKMTIADRTYKMAGRGIVGDAVWGTVDGWRRPRPEWWLTKKLYSPIYIDEHTLQVGSTGEPLRIEIENRHSFINLNRYTCTWKLEREREESGMVQAEVSQGTSGAVQAEVPPGTSGVLMIALQHRPAMDDLLVLEFRDERGRLVDVYRLPFRSSISPTLTSSGKAARIVHEGVHDLSLANAVRLVGVDTELAFDVDTGECLAGLAAGELILVAGPTLHVMKNDAPLEIHPAGWQCHQVEHGEEEGWAVVRLDGHYDGGFTGGFEIKMDNAGAVVVSYHFTYSGPETVSREIGLCFTLPLSCDRLTWERRAEWSYYPSDHIGRPAGTAVAHPPVSQEVPPGKRPWGLDDHPWGCNDFRSTKRHIYRASLTCPTGQGIEVVSDGSQHIRATVGVHDITLMVLDFYGGTATGYSEWDDVYGHGRRLMPGEEISGNVGFRLLTINHAPTLATGYTAWS